VNKPSNPGGSLLLAIVCLVALAAVAPALIALSGALLPLIIVLAIAIVGVRLAFFHTRRW
jgi:hypothetical protein